jgi:hypothetical protein
MGKGSTKAKPPALNGALGMALGCLADELNLTVDDLADRTPYDADDLSVTLLGETPIPDGHGPACLRAMADVIEYQTRAAHCA